MAKNVAALALVAVIVMAVLLAEAPTTKAACSPVQLSPCAPAIMSNKPPSGACCARLRQQKPCLCGYLRNPNLKRYVNSPGAKRVASTCRVSVRC
ncbi:non-specific lipid-transfer protein 2-like [Chenopodium quinoa]|uniref:Bifunctional inhibitor/plant lipid transfer protein/seed storage helical domain-containing protein n=1 Tax=Chenopodium quinoa TaxID=63459 RepID=A0A803LAZ6_CHEQI|nr:non-specific lipid-transfer protein 2-like [Chenopodium quinoa]